MRLAASVGWILFVPLGALAGCGSGPSGQEADAATPNDAGTDAEPAPCDPPHDAGAGDAGPTEIDAFGELALVYPDLQGGFAVGFEVCVAGRPQLPCDVTGSWGQYRLGIPSDAEIALRVHREGFVDWLKPLHSAATDVDALAIAMPTPELTETVLASVGGFRADAATALVYVERPNAVHPLDLLQRGVAGYRVASSAGSVHYANAALDGIDDSAGATAGTGLVLITDIDAPSATECDTPSTISVTISPPDGESLCAEPAIDNVWLRSSDPLEVEAPVFAGHITYAAFITCPGF